MTELKSAQQFDSESFVKSATVDSLQGATEFTAAQFQPTASITSDSNPSDADKTAESALVNVPATGSWLLPVVLTLVGALAVLQWADFVQQSWQHSVLQGGAASALTLTGGVLLARTVYRSWRARRQLARRQALRTEGAVLLQSLQYGEANRWLNKACQDLPASAELQQFHLQQQVHLSDAELLRLFDVMVLERQDQQARQLINAAASQTALAVAVSPFALADLALVSWRSLRLLDELGAVYGMQASLWQRGKLLKAFLQALLWTGGSELALDLSGDLLGAELSSKLSARAGQGVLAGLMVARVGRFACREYRPLALPAQSGSIRPLLAELAQRLMGINKSADKTGS